MHMHAVLLNEPTHLLSTSVRSYTHEDKEENCLVYLDDMVIFTDSLDVHIKHIHHDAR